MKNSVRLLVHTRLRVMPLRACAQLPLAWLGIYLLLVMRIGDVSSLKSLFLHGCAIPQRKAALGTRVSASAGQGRKTSHEVADIVRCCVFLSLIQLSVVESTHDDRYYASSRESIGYYVGH